MASKTNFLSLTLPGNNEYNDNWDEPMNKNFVLIDEEAEVVSNELEAARFEKGSLAEFLSVSHFSDGTLRPVPELSDGRNSQVYGSDDGAGNDYQLKTRIDLGDKEVWDARENVGTLQDALARRARDFDHHDHVISAASTPEGQPNFLSSAAAEFKLDGDPTPIVFNINGYYMDIFLDISVPVSGGDGTKYLVAKKPATPYLSLDKPTEEAGVTTTNALNNDKVQIFQDGTEDFTTLDLRVGMILRITNTANAGDYIIDEIAPGGTANQLLIIGDFVNAIGTINYQIIDMLRPEFSIETTYSIEAGKCIIAEGEFIGGALVSSFAYNYKGKYESQYEAVNVATLATFEQIYTHNLGIIPTKINILASQTSDESTPSEPLSQALVENDLTPVVNNTQVYTPGVFNAGTTDAAYTPGSFTGTIGVTLTGSVFNLKSVITKITKTQIFIKNVKDNHFYRDYDLVDRDSGFLKVVCEK